MKSIYGIIIAICLGFYIIHELFFFVVETPIILGGLGLVLGSYWKRIKSFFTGVPNIQNEPQIDVNEPQNGAIFEEEFEAIYETAMKEAAKLIDFCELRKQGWHITNSMTLQFCKKIDEKTFEFKQWDKEYSPIPQELTILDWGCEDLWTIGVIYTEDYEGLESDYLLKHGATFWDNFKTTPNAYQRLAGFIFDTEYLQFKV